MAGSYSQSNAVQEAAEHAHPADRFAREILAILGRDISRSRRLMRHMFGAYALFARYRGVISLSLFLLRTAKRPRSRKEECMAIDPDRLLIERWFHDLFTNPNSSILEQLVTEDFVTRDPSGKIGAANPSAFLAWLQWYRSSFTDATWQILDFLRSDDKVVVRYAGQTTYRGGLFQIPAKNQRVTEMGILIFQIRQNRICTLWSALSDLELMLEMGAIPTVPPDDAETNQQ